MRGFWVKLNRGMKEGKRYIIEIDGENVDVKCIRIKDGKVKISYQSGSEWLEKSKIKIVCAL